ncbi:flagellar hook-length control protein FliK [Paraburkholderia sp.]|jgi:hypothetical protein|uniref:flagellar hook-length control protein FliK n=1 Tax=Paraburkholderia sp. TaxID=1926495 RepID=UPI002F41B188
MNGIDSAIASLLSSPIDSLLNIAPGTATTSQAGASALSVETPVTPGTPAAPAAPPASAQTALSAVALTLNAIALSGGEATPAIVGQLPIWPAAPALDVALAELPLFESLIGEMPDAGAAPSGLPAGTAAGGAAGSAGAAAGTATAAAAASVAAAPMPVAALAAALKDTVAGSGLFYESHLAQWLAGQLAPADLAAEPQNQLLDSETQLPLNWAADAEAASSSSATGAQQQGRAGAAQTSGGAPDAGAAARALPSIQSPQAARFVAGEMLANSLADLATQSGHAALHAAAQLTDAAPQTQQAAAAAVNAVTIPLVRQQLDMLATGQFRWTGEAWPGAKLDWTIQQDGDEWQRGGGGAEAEEDYPWRTRLTLSLPRLGTVDAELVLTGTRLMARVLASPLGAARLTQQSEGFKQRLAAAGIELNGLSIREIGGGAPAGASNAAAAAAAQAAASAYARSATAGEPSPAARRPVRGERPAAKSDTDFDWDM